MKKKTIYIFIGILCSVLAIPKLVIPTRVQSTNFSEKVKVVLRQVGNQLLLSDNDSTSLVLPVLELTPLKYKLSFEKQLRIKPKVLVDVLEKHIRIAQLPSTYLTEVLGCEDNEVAYSFEVKKSVDTDIIPCRGRDLEQNCYTITVRFTEVEQYRVTSYIWYVQFFVGILLIGMGYVFKKKTKKNTNKSDKQVALGSFYFYPTQNKLIQQSIEISLSQKECEILILFVNRPNEVITREELTKTVWEDNGVFVSRSLDTYISMLRKKLKTDTSLKLTNVHGVGYKLEVL